MDETATQKLRLSRSSSSESRGAREVTIEETPTMRCVSFILDLIGAANAVAVENSAAQWRSTRVEQNGLVHRRMVGGWGSGSRSFLRVRRR